jgi:tRNA modification GTPase
MPIGNLVPATDDTIVAIATPPTAAARGIVRMAGPQALACLCTGFTADAPAALANLRRPTAVAGRWTFRELGDRQLCCDAYIWPGVQSFSRQPTVELHLLGSPPLLEAIVDQCCAAGARLARPGEFTLRAFLAGRLDLVQAEAVLGLIDARDSAQFRTALQQLAAGLGGRLHALQGQLLDLLAELEAGLDFADEALDLLPAGQVVAQLADIARALQDFRSQLTRRSVAGRRLRVALIGPPNAGKSSLFNALTTQGQALVSPQAGTTRDYLVQPLQLGDLEVELIDTAGIESQQPQGAIDLAAQRQARLQSEQTARSCWSGRKPIGRGRRRRPIA